MHSLLQAGKLTKAYLWPLGVRQCVGVVYVTHAVCAKVKPATEGEKRGRKEESERGRERRCMVD